MNERDPHWSDRVTKAVREDRIFPADLGASFLEGAVTAFSHVEGPSITAKRLRERADQLDAAERPQEADHAGG